MAKVEPVHVFQKLSEKMHGRDLKTVGNPTNAARDASDLLKQIQKLDGNKSGVFKNGASLVKQMRDIISKAQTSGAGGASSGSGVGAGLAGGASSGASSTVAEAMRRVADDQTDGEYYDAASEAAEAAEDVAHVESVIATVATGVTALINTESASEAQAAVISVWDALGTLTGINPTNLPWRVVGDVMRSMRDLLLALNFAWSLIPVGFGTSRLTLAYITLFDSVDLQGAAVLIPVADELAAVMVAFSHDEAEVLVDAAARLQAAVRAPAETDEEDGCTKRMMIEYVENWLVTNQKKAEELTDTELSSLTRYLVDSCKAKKNKNLFPTQPSSDNAGSFIPDVGSMVEQTMKSFVKRSDVDQGKIKSALDKFSYNQAVAEKLRQVVKQKLQPNQTPKPPGASDGATS